MTILYFKGSLHLFIFLFIYSIITPKIYAQDSLNLDKKIFYLVRHAEKESGSNPALTRAGMQRSGDLQRAFRESKALKLPEIILVTQFKRTQLTADSLRIIEKIDTVQYIADTNGNGFIEALQIHKKVKKLLVIGHSNTIPVILRRLGVDYKNDIPDHVYDLLFIVTYEKGKPVLRIKNYGNPSTVKGDSGDSKMLQ